MHYLRIREQAYYKSHTLDNITSKLKLNFQIILWCKCGAIMQKENRKQLIVNYLRFLLVRQDIEILSLWEDFKKVVKFIDENFEWLNPLMEHITHKKLSLE